MLNKFTNIVCFFFQEQEAKVAGSNTEIWYSDTILKAAELKHYKQHIHPKNKQNYLRCERLVLLSTQNRKKKKININLTCIYHRLFFFKTDRKQSRDQRYIPQHQQLFCLQTLCRNSTDFSSELIQLRTHYLKKSSKTECSYMKAENPSSGLRKTFL